MSEEKILIIDDDNITATVLDEYLSNFGYKVYYAIDGSDGLEKTGKFDPDLILLDIMMPGKDGIQILKELKLTPEFASIPILLLTSIDRTNIKVKGLEMGADDYITKPVDKAELLARIKVSLKRSNKNKRDSHILDGNLSDFNIVDLLQSIELGRKTAIINFPDMDAEIILRDGVIIKSRQGNFSGIKSINRMFLLEKGKFSVEFNKVTDDKTDIPLIIMNILLENISYIDEVKNMAKFFHPLDRKMKASKDLLKLTEVAGIETLPTISIRELIAMMKGNLKDNVKSLIQIKKDFPDLMSE